MKHLIILSLLFSVLCFLYYFLSHCGIYILALFKGKQDRKNLIPLAESSPIPYILSLSLFTLLFYFASQEFFAQFFDFYFSLISILIVLNTFSLSYYYYNKGLKSGKYNNVYTLVYGFLCLINCVVLALIIGALLQSKTVRIENGFFKQLGHYFNGISLCFAVFFTALAGYLGTLNLFIKAKTEFLNIKNVQQNLMVNVGFIIASCFFLVLACYSSLCFLIPKIINNARSVLCIFLIFICLSFFAVAINSEKYNFAKFINYVMAFLIFMVFAFSKFPMVIVNSKFSINFIDVMQKSELYFALGLGLSILFSIILPVFLLSGFNLLKSIGD